MKKQLYMLGLCIILALSVPFAITAIAATWSISAQVEPVPLPTAVLPDAGGRRLIDSPNPAANPTPSTDLPAFPSNSIPTVEPIVLPPDYEESLMAYSKWRAEKSISDYEIVYLTSHSALLDADTSRLATDFSEILGAKIITSSDEWLTAISQAHVVLFDASLSDILDVETMRRAFLNGVIMAGVDAGIDQMRAVTQYQCTEVGLHNVLPGRIVSIYHYVLNVQNEADRAIINDSETRKCQSESVSSGYSLYSSFSMDSIETTEDVNYLREKMLLARYEVETR